MTPEHILRKADAHCLVKTDTLESMVDQNDHKELSVSDEQESLPATSPANAKN